MPQMISVFLTPRFLRFCTVGASGVFVNLGALAALSFWAFHPMFASAIAIEISILSNFAANEFWTFRDRGEQAQRLQRLWQFQLVSLVGALVQFTVFFLAYFCWSLIQQQALGISVAEVNEDWLNAIRKFMVTPPDVGLALYAAQLLGIGLATAWNFCANLFWTWQAPENSGHDSPSA